MPRLFFRCAMPKIRPSAAFLVFLPLITQELAAQNVPAPAPRTGLWTIHQPYPNNSLRDATVSGSLAADGDTRSAELQIECRAPELPRLSLLFPSPGLKFNLDPFEGPPGIGQKRKLLAMTLDRDPPRTYFFSGYYVESDRFVFAFALTRADARRLVSAAGKPLRIRVSPADGHGRPLDLTFTLPADSAPVRDVAKPCLEPKEPDPHSR
jgi:hypothetical protein